MKEELLELIQAYAQAKSMNDYFEGTSKPVDEALSIIWQQIESRIEELVGN
ncbi:hypothetical protein [Cronobacter phage vB_Cdu_VP8]|nr:hypothetical protein [Cronobacter phage vB_Cdu_VP8]